jgi:hypothetical protein
MWNSPLFRGCSRRHGPSWSASTRNHSDEVDIKLRETAPDNSDKATQDQHFGPLIKSQLKRIFPGLIRVEVLLDEEHYGAQDEPDKIPVTPHESVDAQACCHLSDYATNESGPPILLPTSYSCGKRAFARWASVTFQT